MAGPINTNFSQIGRQLQRQLENRQKQFAKRIEDVLEEESKKIRDLAKARVPVDSGKLKKSIKVKKIGSRLNVAFQIGSELEYALYVEYGTGKFAANGDGRQTPWVYYKNGRFYFTHGMHPQPFLIPTFNDRKEEVIRAVNRELGVWWT
jgi:HK97 gp10 family phage protein